MKKAKKRGRKTLVSTAVRDVIHRLRENIRDASTDENAPMLPTAEAMGLAEMLLNHTTAPKKRGEVTQIRVAEMLDSALRVRRVAAETGGIAKGLDEANNLKNRQIVEGVMARIGIAEQNRNPPAVMQLAFHEALVLLDALRFHGYGPQKAVQAQQWTVRRTDANRERA